METKITPNEYTRLFELAKSIAFSFKVVVGEFPTSFIGVLGKATKIVEFIKLNKASFEEIIRITKD